jgi:DNA-binding response OmpR family regulator
VPGRRPAGPANSLIALKSILLVGIGGWDCAPLAQRLEQAGCEVQWERVQDAALAFLARGCPDLLVVVGPTDLAFYGALRRTCSAPMLVLAAGASEEDMLAAFAVGVDQFQPWPISCGEAAARALALLRRAASVKKVQGN